MPSQTAISRRSCLKRCGVGLAGLALAGVNANRPIWAEETGAAPTVDETIKQLAAEAPLAMRFRGSSADECRQWQAQFAAKLRELLGPHTPPKQWETIVEEDKLLDNHRRLRLVLSADGHPSLPVYLLIPEGKADRPRAGVLALHGHGDYGYEPVAGRDDLPGVAAAIAKANYDYGRQLVRRGYVVAAPCMMPFGRRIKSRQSYGGNDPCAVTFVRMQLLGRVLMAENLRDCLWAFEMLSRREEVDAGRMACVGLSYGGRMTMLTSALEPRIKVAVPSGSLNVMQERASVRYSCGAQVIPGLLKYGDVPEIGSLIAPRHCVWETGDQDGLIKPDWAEKALVRIRRAYAAYGAADRLQVDRFSGGHRWNGEVAYPLLDELLGG